MSTHTIRLAADFSPCPAGRYPEDGPYPGAAFRDGLLLPAMKQHDIVVVDMEGTEMAGSSFLEEAFGGLVRIGKMTESLLRKKLKVLSPRKTDEVRIWRYIHDEALRSKLA